ncbi:MAG: hypothetical protein N2557_06970 [Hydrogenophilus sp.]|nr:hypothetical protein [Hydrogenophilus sp.]
MGFGKSGESGGRGEGEGTNLDLVGNVTVVVEDLVAGGVGDEVVAEVAAVGVELGKRGPGVDRFGPAPEEARGGAGLMEGVLAFVEGFGFGGVGEQPEGFALTVAGGEVGEEVRGEEGGGDRGGGGGV